MKNNDFVHTAQKPDFYTIIIRRKRTAAGILVENEVTSIKKLNQLKEFLEKTYTVSQEFMRDAENALRERSLTFPETKEPTEDSNEEEDTRLIKKKKTKKIKKTKIIEEQ